MFIDEKSGISTNSTAHTRNLIHEKRKKNEGKERRSDDIQAHIYWCMHQSLENVYMHSKCIDMPFFTFHRFLFFFSLSYSLLCILVEFKLCCLSIISLHCAWWSFERHMNAHHDGLQVSRVLITYFLFRFNAHISLSCSLFYPSLLLLYSSPTLVWVHVPRGVHWINYRQKGMALGSDGAYVAVH